MISIEPFIKATVLIKIMPKNQFIFNNKNNNLSIDLFFHYY